jgi:hypothetical protein
MSSRSRNRLVTVLLLALVAFGGVGSGFAMARLAGVTVTICARQRRPTRPRRLAEARPRTIAPPPMRTDISWREQRPPDFFVCHELFQRPPPVLLSLA